MLTGKAKTDYMREYMRRRRSNQKGSNATPKPAVRPVRPQKELTYERDDYSQ